MPIPASRRQFLRSSLATSTLVSMGAQTVPTFLSRSARAADGKGGERILVVVQLNGGNDGLNTIVPHKHETRWGQSGPGKEPVLLRERDARVRVGVHQQPARHAHLWPRPMEASAFAARVLHRQQYRPASLSDRESCADVLTEIQCFEGDGVGPVLLEELAQTRVDGGQPALGGQPGGGGDDPAVGGREPMATPNDDSKAAVGKAGIDAEDHHRTVILRGGPDASLRPGRARCEEADYLSTPSTDG